MRLLRNENMFKGKGSIFVAIVLLFIIAAGVTMAYFTDHAAKMNEFVFGNGIKSELSEPKWDSTGSIDAQSLLPNKTILKDPTITNVGDVESFNFIAFRVPYDKFAALGTFDAATGQCSDFDVNGAGQVDVGAKDLFTHTVGDNWILVESKIGNGYHEYVYAYATGKDASTATMTALGKNNKTLPLFVGEKIRTINLVEDKWATANGCVLVENQHFNIPVRAYSIQTTDLITSGNPNNVGATDPASVWQIVKAQVNSKYLGMAEEKWGNVTGINDGNGNDASVHGTTGVKPLA